jgi:hypothetical protein
MVEETNNLNAEELMPTSVFEKETDVLMSDFEYDFSVANP